MIRTFFTSILTGAISLLATQHVSAQTTLSDYQFIKSQLPSEMDKGILSDPNYILVGPTESLTGWRDRQADIFTLLNKADSSFVAEVVHYHRSEYNEERFICVPTNTAPPKLWEYSFRDLKDDNVFTQYFMIKAMTTALSSH